MKKFLCMMLMLITLGMSGFAQVLSDYIMTTGTDATKWQTLTTTTNLITGTGDSKASAVTDIGFTFNFAGTNYTQFSVNSDGNLRFGAAVTGTGNYSTPFSSTNANSNNPKINMMGCDGYITDSGYVYHEVIGTAPDRVCVIEFATSTYNTVSRPSLLRWQVQLFEGSNNIQIVYYSAMPPILPNVARQPGMCVNNTDIILIDNYHNAVHYTTGQSTNSCPITTWPDVNRYYLFTISDCPTPGNFNAATLGSTSVDLTWTSATGGTDFVLQYKTPTTDWSNATTENAYDTTYNLTGLTPSTTYQLRVAQLCNSDTSNWAYLTLTTACAPVATLPWTDNLDSYPGSTSGSTNNLPYCWSYLNTATTSSSSYKGYPIIYASATYAASGSNSLRFYSYQTTGTYGDEMVILPQIDADLYPVNTLQLSFDARNYSTYTFKAYIGVITNPSLQSTFVVLDSLETTSNTYQTYDFPLNQYTGPNGYIAILAKQPASSYNAGYIDNFVVDVIPTCPKPKDLTASNPTLTSIDLSWLEMGSATTWEIEYGPMGFAQGTGTVETATTNPYTINGLEPSSGYDFYVRANCGGGDLSEFSTKTTAATACALVSTMPFTEDFDGYPGVTTNTVDVLPYCWSKLNTGTTYPGLPNIYASATFAASGSNSLHFYTYSTTAYADQTAVLPQIDITSYPISNLQLTMDVRASSATNPFVLVVGVMTDPADATTFTAVDTIVWQTTAYTTFEIPLSHYTGAGGYIAVKAPKPASGYNYGYVDNVVVNLLPSCPIPRHLTATNATTTSVELTWDEMGSATSWDIEFGPMGFTPGTGTVESASTNPYTVNGLNPSAGYDFYVRANCGGGNVSNYTKKMTAATACAPIAELPYMENFDAYPSNTTGTTSYLPYCWSNISTSTSSSYAGYPIIYTSATYAASGSNSLRFYSYYNVTASSPSDYGDQTAILPEIDITTHPINTLQLSLDVRDNSTSYPFHLIVGVMTDTTFTPVDTIITSSTAYANYIVDFSSYGGTGNRMALMAKKPATSGSYNYGYVDNLILEPIPACQRPSGISAVSTASDTVFLTWTDNYGSLWDVAYGPIGFDPDDASEATLETGIDTTAFNVTGLAYGTGYEFYVRSDCGGAVSAWVMNPAVGYPYTYTMGISGSDTLTSCGIFISDNGGPNGDYANSCNYTLVVFPSETDSVVSISGTFDGESTLDYLSVYNGVGTDDNNLLQKVISGATGNVVTFGPLNSTTGPLTLLFHSDGSVVRPGFMAQISCVEPPACPQPFDVHAVYVSNNEATVTWGVLEGASSTFDLAFSTAAGFNPDTCTNIITVNTNEYTFTGLTAFTNYYVAVRANCGTDASEWSVVTHFRTACDPITSLPFIENFDTYTGSTSGSSNNLPYCWSYINNGTSTTYIGYPIVYASATYAASGDNSLRFYTYTTSGTYDDQIAVLPNIDATSHPINTLQMSFDARIYSTSYTPFTLVVGVLSNPMDKTTFVPVDTIEVTSTTYQHYEFVFNGYEGNGTYIGLMAPQSTTTYNAGNVDNILVEPIPSCPKPMDVTATGVTPTSMTLTWTEVGEANSWEVEYGPVGFTPGSAAGTVETVTSEPPFTISNLTPATTYDVYVRSDCGGEYSLYSTKLTVFIPCTALDSLPYVEGFDTYGTGTGIYPTCWDRINTYSTTTNYPYITTTHYDGVGSLYFYAGTSGTYNIAVSPMIDESIPVNTLQTTFMWRASNATSRLEVGVMTNPANASTFVPVDTIVASATSSWEGFEVPFSQYTGEGHYIAFRVAYNSSATGYGYLDSVVIDLIPSCPRPLHVTASNITTSSVDLSWDQNGNPNSWVIEYGPNGFAPGTGTEVTATTNPYTVTGLDHSTVYDFYVTADCGGGDVSQTSFVYSAATACAAIDQLPYTENFDAYGTGSTAYPLCWNKYTTYTASTSLPYINSTHYAGVGSLYFYCTSGTYNVAITPEFDATIPINTLQATFMYRATNSTDFLIVGVMSNPADFSTFVPVDTVAPTGTASTWTEKEVVFNGYTGNGHYIAFHNGNPTASCYTYIDNLFIDLIPACPKPQDLHLVNATTTSVELGWTEVGSATAWEIAYGTPGFDPNSTSATVVTATSNPFTINNLNNSTVYEFYVRSACGGTDHSYWSNSTQGSTTMVPVGLPYTADFADPNDTWVLNGGNCTNYWVRGTVNNEASLFVTNNGTTPGYTITTISANAAQKLFTVGTSDTITITFDVMVDGEGGYDYLKLFLAPASTQFLPSTTAPGTGDYAHRDYSTNAYNFYANGYGTQSSYPYVLNKLTDTIHVVAKMPNPNATPTSSSTALLALVWRNDVSGGTQPPAIVKNLTVTASGSGPVITDPTVATNAAENITPTSATLKATVTNPDNVTITTKGFEWKATTGGTYTQVTATSATSGYSYDLTGLTPSTGYTYRAFITFNGQTVYGSEMTFTTAEQGQEPCDVPTGLTASDIQGESVTITWNNDANVNSWNIQYRPMGGQLSTATSNTNSYTITGLTGGTTYQIQVQANCGDGNLSDWSSAINVTTTGIANWLENSVTLFPNPAKEYVDIRIDGDLNVTMMEVYDVYGKLINTVNVIDNPTRINVSSLANGMYFVRVTTEAGSVTKTFVKKG
ncbi:MAG: fibronectin type III domain-containing protein [Bacteroidales bacterium]|nr:fibronectin type III domain-containing protein [Bacteroidales bacterium]